MSDAIEYCPDCETNVMCHLDRRCMKRMAGMEGSTPASGSGVSVAVPDQTPHKLSDSASPFGGQGKGELQRVLVSSWREEAKVHTEARQQMEDTGRTYAEGYHKGLADGFLNCAIGLEAALRREPRAQSDTEEVEECPFCHGHSLFDNRDGDRECMTCGTIRARRLGRDRIEAMIQRAKEETEHEHQ